MLKYYLKPAFVHKRRADTAQKGAAMGWLILIMVVLIALAAFVIQVVDNNTVQLVQQEQGLKAFYAAESGINIGVAAMLTPTGPRASDPSQDDTLYWRYQSGTFAQIITDTFEVDTDGTTVELTIQAVTDTAGINWVELRAKGSVSYRGKNIERTNVLWISLTDPAITKRITS